MIRPESPRIASAEPLPLRAVRDRPDGSNRGSESPAVVHRGSPSPTLAQDGLSWLGVARGGSPSPTLARTPLGSAQSRPFSCRFRLKRTEMVQGRPLSDRSGRVSPGVTQV